MQRRLAHHQHQGAALLQGDVGGPGEQGGGHPGGDLAHGPDRAGGDDHAQGVERARRDRGSDIGRPVRHIGARLDVGDGEIGLLSEGQGRGAGQDQVALDPQFAAGLQHAQAIGDAAGPGYAHHQPRKLGFRHAREPFDCITGAGSGARLANICDLTGQTSGCSLRRSFNGRRRPTWPSMLVSVNSALATRTSKE